MTKKDNHFVMFNVGKVQLLTLRTFSEVLPTLILSWNFTRPRKQTDFQPTNWTTKIFLLTKLFITNYDFASLSKNCIVTTKNWYVMVWRWSPLCSSWDSPKHYKLEQTSIYFSRQCGRKKMQSFKIFLHWHYNKDFFSVFGGYTDNGQVF